MLRSKAYVRKTRRGKVLKIVREHYLRTDIWCGCPSCKLCDTSDALFEPSADEYVVLDTNVVLHQMDMLENHAITDVIVPSVVREEVKHRNISVYNRLRALCADKTKRFYVFANEYHEETYTERSPNESPNDRNDRAIRTCALWYQKHLPHIKLVLVTNDKANMNKALEAGLKAQTAIVFAQSRSSQPQLLDLVARPQNEEDSDEEDQLDSRPQKRQAIYREHLPLSELERGIREGRFHQGTLRTNRHDPSKASVASESVGQAIQIKDHIDMNRTVDGDRVVLELLPEDQWGAEAATLREGDGDEGEEEEPEAGLAPAPAEEGHGVGVG
eukprot:CAMPEP_0198233138 /NCGR_PEP_ID=MMETSP1445-20131203/116087_1 /TAXON_ID=36898 /ORGANISM="Pyramimonas sp., Strain CCMP2087" /LENGTH=328 /DNA_ID=CAMNT_0043913827 /DNA_START=141 /DNA_END=1123 /DNA_ORIENTATION=-